MENYIQLKKDNILRFGIKDSEGKDTGNYLEFDMEDIELPLRLQQCEIDHKKNLAYIKDQFVIIDKKEDKSGKHLLSWKEEQKIEAIKEFFTREMKALNLFLGENGCEKLLNGRKPYYEMYNDIAEMLEPILPIIKDRKTSITDKIKEKYTKKEDNVLE